MIYGLSTAQLRALFHLRTRQAAELRQQSAPLRAAYDQLRAEECALQDQQRVLADQFRAIEGPCFPIDMERAAIARALKSQTGRPEEYPEDMLPDEARAMPEAMTPEEVAEAYPGAPPVPPSPDQVAQQVAIMLGREGDEKLSAAIVAAIQAE